MNFNTMAKNKKETVKTKMSFREVIILAGHMRITNKQIDELRKKQRDIDKNKK